MKNKNPRVWKERVLINLYRRFFYKLIQGAALTANHYFGSLALIFLRFQTLLSSHSGKVALFDVFRFIQILLRANANITYRAHVNFWPFKRQPSGGPSR